MDINWKYSLSNKSIYQSKFDYCRTGFLLFKKRLAFRTRARQLWSRANRSSAGQIGPQDPCSFSEILEENEVQRGKSCAPSLNCGRLGLLVDQLNPGARTRPSAWPFGLPDIPSVLQISKHCEDGVWTRAEEIRRPGDASHGQAGRTERLCLGPAPYGCRRLPRPVAMVSSKTSCDADTYSIRNLQLDLIQILSPGLMESVHKGGVWVGKVNWRQMQTLWLAAGNAHLFKRAKTKHITIRAWEGTRGHTVRPTLRRAENIQKTNRLTVSSNFSFPPRHQWNVLDAPLSYLHFKAFFVCLCACIFLLFPHQRHFYFWLA